MMKSVTMNLSAVTPQRASLLQEGPALKAHAVINAPSSLEQPLALRMMMSLAMRSLVFVRATPINAFQVSAAIIGSGKVMDQDSMQAVAQEETSALIHAIKTQTLRQHAQRPTWRTRFRNSSEGTTPSQMAYLVGMGSIGKRAKRLSAEGGNVLINIAGQRQGGRSAQLRAVPTVSNLKSLYAWKMKTRLTTRIVDKSQ